MITAARDSQKTWRVIDIIKWGEQYFAENNFTNPRKEIEILLQDILDCGRIDLYLRFEELLLEKHRTLLREWVLRRKNREPLQYITGKAAFHKLMLKVTPDVLIPRPESERLVELLIETTDKNSDISILDIGTGSGCLALAVGKELPKARITGIDNSTQAIKVAILNAGITNTKNVDFIQLDFLKSDIKEKYDIVLSNPPYIPNDEIGSLMIDVKNFEPFSALSDSADGLTFYRKISEISQDLLNKNGWIFLEVGLGNHPQKVLDLFSNEKFRNVKLFKDYNGDDRVFIAQVV